MGAALANMYLQEVAATYLEQQIQKEKGCNKAAFAAQVRIGMQSGEVASPVTQAVTGGVGHGQSEELPLLPRGGRGGETFHFSFSGIIGA